MNQIRKLPGERSISQLLFITWITYFSIYLGRLNFSSGMSEMTAVGGFSKAALGGVAAAFFLAYGFGQIISGVLGDRFSQALLVFIGIIGSAAVNLQFPFAPTTGVMAVLWFLNGASQSLIWAPMVRLVADRTTGPQCVRILVILSTTSPAGMLCSYAFSAWMLRIGGWKLCFWGAALWMLAIAILWLVRVRSLEKYADESGEIEVPAEQDKVDPIEGEASHVPSMRLLTMSGLGWLITAVCLQGILKDGLVTWIPTYLTETFSIESFLSVALTAVLPIVNLSCVYLANYCNKRLFHSEAVTALFFFLVALAAVVCMMLFGDRSVYGTILLFAIVTSSMTAVNTALITLVPIHFQRFGSVSTTTGVLNAAAYIGSALASVLFGRTAEMFGWNGVRSSWCVLAALGVLSCLLAVRKWKAFSSDIYIDC